MKHKHAEVLNAIAEGKTVQWRNPEGGIWHDAVFKPYTPLTNDELEWRIKPEPLPDVVKYIAFEDFGSKLGFMTKEYSIMREWENRIKLIFDGETGKLMNAEVL